MLSSESLVNCALSSGSLILGGLYLQQKLGHLNATKFFAASMIVSYSIITAFGPNTAAYNLNIRSVWPDSLRIDCYGKKQQMGADILANSVVYMVIIYHRYFMIAAAFTLFDLAYLGPTRRSAPAVAFTAGCCHYAVNMSIV
jgi:hypothetical protein